MPKKIKQAEPAKKSEPKKYTHQCIYAGRVIDGKGKVWQKFLLLPERTPQYYNGIKCVILGYTYPCNLANMPIRPLEVPGIEREDNVEWERDDALVAQKLTEKRAKARYEKEATPALNRAVEALKPLCQKLGYADRQALVEYLVKQAIR